MFVLQRSKLFINLDHSRIEDTCATLPKHVPAASLSTLGATLTDAGRWIGSVLGVDRKIYGMPNNASGILIIDHVAGTAGKFQLTHHCRIELFDRDGDAAANFTFASDDKAKRAAKTLEFVVGEAFPVTRAE